MLGNLIKVLSVPFVLLKVEINHKFTINLKESFRFGSEQDFFLKHFLKNKKNTLAKKILSKEWRCFGAPQTLIGQ